MEFFFLNILFCETLENQAVRTAELMESRTAAKHTIPINNQLSGHHDSAITKMAVRERTYAEAVRILS
jgi:hypothetical protein